MAKTLTERHMNRLIAIHRVESAKTRLSCSRSPEARKLAERVLAARQKILSHHIKTVRVNGIP